MRVVVDMIDTLGLVCFKRKVRCSTPQIPDLDRAIQTRRSKSVCVLGIDRKPHDIMTVPIKHLHALPPSIPIPHLDRHVIAGGEDKGLLRMHDDRANVVWMCFERGDLLGRVVVVHT